MGSIRPWQLILFVLAMVALFGGLFLSCRGGVDLADSMLMADVQTGDRFRFDLSGHKGVTIPAKHPETGERTLLPIIKIDGKWVIGPRYRPALEYLGEDSLVVDLESFEIELSDKSVRSGRR